MADLEYAGTMRKLILCALTLSMSSFAQHTNSSPAKLSGGFAEEEDTNKIPDCVTSAFSVGAPSRIDGGAVPKSIQDQLAMITSWKLFAARMAVRKFDISKSSDCMNVRADFRNKVRNVPALREDQLVEVSQTLKSLSYKDLESYAELMNLNLAVLFQRAEKLSVTVRNLGSGAAAEELSAVLMNYSLEATVKDFIDIDRKRRMDQFDLLYSVANPGGVKRVPLLPKDSPVEVAT